MKYILIIEILENKWEDSLAKYSKYYYQSEYIIKALVNVNKQTRWTNSLNRIEIYLAIFLSIFSFSMRKSI